MKTILGINKQTNKKRKTKKKEKKKLQKKNTTVSEADLECSSPCGYTNTHGIAHLNVSSPLKVFVGPKCSSVLLIRLALEEIMKETKRARERAQTMGPMGW